MTARLQPMPKMRVPRRCHGLAAVEFVVAAPLLIFLMLAAAELGRAFVHYDTLSYSIRSSARFVSENAIEGTTGVVSLSSSMITEARCIAVHGNVACSGGRVLPSFQTSHVTVASAGNDNIRVTALYPYQSILGAVLPTFGLGGGSIPLAFNMRIVVTMRAIT